MKSTLLIRYYYLINKFSLKRLRVLVHCSNQLLPKIFNYIIGMHMFFIKIKSTAQGINTLKIVHEILESDYWNRIWIHEQETVTVCTSKPKWSKSLKSQINSTRIYSKVSLCYYHFYIGSYSRLRQQFVMIMVKTPSCGFSELFNFFDFFHN